MKPDKIGTVALVVSFEGNSPRLIETFSDDKEIALFEAALQTGGMFPLECVYELRSRQSKEDDEFGDYVEELLTQPFVRSDIQEHGVQWLKSKMKIEHFKKCEFEATRVIAGYAFKLYAEDQKRTDFLLAGPQAKVRIRIFTLPVAFVASEAA